MITINKLDSKLKNIVRDAIRTKLLKAYRTLPLPNQTDMVFKVLTADVKKELNNLITKHYRMLMEHDVECRLTDEDFVNIYFNNV